MPIRLVDALIETLADWQNDLPANWRTELGEISLGFDQCDTQLMLEHWEPIFPARRDKTFPGAPDGAHMLSAFDDINPADVRCVLLGQDPYPSPEFSTGRAFEAGNLAAWRELDKMFSKSVRVFMQQICQARTGNQSYARSFDDWPLLLSDIEAAKIDLQAPDKIADHWVEQGVLLLNSSLTLSRFQRDIDPHQSAGHANIWSPLTQAVLKHFKFCGRPIVFIAFGEVAIQHLHDAGISGQSTVERAHPAYAETVLAKENPFIAANRYLVSQQAEPVSW